MSKRNGKPIHSGRLFRSSQDVITLAVAVEERFLKLCYMWKQSMGTELAPPKSLDRDVWHWRTMCVRHKGGDFRHSELELRSTQAVAQWTLDVKAQLCNQPTEKLEWRQ